MRSSLNDESWRLQARLAAMSDWIAATPGICNGGRALACDDLDALGWRRVGEILERDGVLTFRFLPVERAAELAGWATARRYRLDFWDVLSGDRATVVPAAQSVLARPLPDGLEERAVPSDPDGDIIADIQALMAASDVSPYAGPLLVGIWVPGRTAILVDQSGRVVATALCQRSHGPGSRYHRHAFGGAVAVSREHRGRGLGRHVNALMAVHAFRHLDATHLYQFVSSDNLQSRRMVEAIGLRRDPTTIAAAITVSGTRFTR